METQIYILYNCELYKLIIKIYVHNYVSIFFSRKMFIIVGSKGFVPYFYNDNTKLYNKFEFLQNYTSTKFFNNDTFQRRFQDNHR